MEEIKLSDFKKNLNSIIKSVSRTEKSVLVSDQEGFLVKIIPASSADKNSWLGCMSDSGKIVGDIMSPAEEPNVWEALAE